MYRTVRFAVLLGTAGLVLLAPDVAAAAEPAAPPAVNDLGTVVNNLRYWIMGILGSVATLFLCIGGARYLMAGGDPSEIERAKGSFKSAAVGYALALLAPVVLTVLNSILVK
ncbi:pilin [Actinoplanes sp. NPDC024001]|uniref:pilin n=1 Tax=Actinoplanes sp. NPDC024001 TaxID=3154598 RepID=UPI003411D27A